ncbi:MAG: hypothetical protein V1792_02585 [Pseudomonadota bacterium]
MKRDCVIRCLPLDYPTVLCRVVIDGRIFGRYDMSNRDTGRRTGMPVSLRIPRDKEEMIRRAAAKEGMSKTAYILKAIDEKPGIAKNREQTIRELAGWMSREEAEELRQSLKVFEEIHEGDRP